AAYAASNVCLDAFVHGRNRTSPLPWVSINWDNWQLKEKNDQDGGSPSSAQAELAITPKEGIEVFQRIISMRTAGQVVISTWDLPSRIRRWIVLESSPAEQPQARLGPGSEHDRPNLKTAYAAPRNELEQSIAGIWQNLLGIEQIGIHDDFFELGGHSLLA